jgi:acyl dehydratase
MPTRPIDELRGMVGESIHTTEGLLVERGKVEEFARSLRDGNPVFRDEATAADRGFATIPAPLTFSRTAHFPRYRPEGVDSARGFDLGFEREYTLHGEQTYEFERPLVVGDELDGVTTLVDVFERDGRRGGTMTFAVLETAFTDAAGDPVLTARSTSIETGGTVTGGSEADPDREVATPDRADDRVPDRPLRAGDVAVGDGGPTVALPALTRRDFVRYAGASGDFNPIHYDEPFATGAGNPSVFGQGMLTAGVAATQVTDWFGVGRIESFRTRFRSRLFPGDGVSATGEVTAVEAAGDGAERVEATVAVERDDGDPLVTGAVTARLPPRAERPADE